MLQTGSYKAVWCTRGSGEKSLFFSRPIIVTDMTPWTIALRSGSVQTEFFSLLGTLYKENPSLPYQMHEFGDNGFPRSLLWSLETAMNSNIGYLSFEMFLRCLSFENCLLDSPFGIADISIPLYGSYQLGKFFKTFDKVFFSKNRTFGKSNSRTMKIIVLQINARAATEVEF